MLDFRVPVTQSQPLGALGRYEEHIFHLDPMRRKARSYLWIGLAALVPLLLWLKGQQERLETSNKGEFKEEGPRIRSGPGRAPAEEPSRSVRLQRSARNAIQSAIASASTRQEQVVVQADVRSIIRAMDREEAIGLILEYLESGEDYDFDLNFSVSFKGELATAPTLRVLFLDLLRELDAKAARKVSERILEHRESVDEWAISLKNVVWHSRVSGIERQAAERDFVKTKMEEMFSHAPWREKPGPALLESFDFWVNLADTESFDKVMSMRTPGNPESIHHAARIAAGDFLSVNSRDVIQHLCQEERISSIHPKIAGVLLSKADPRDPQQMEAIKRLMGNRRGEDPLAETFFRYFPNFQESVHPRLISREPVPTPVVARAKANAALDVLKKWHSDKLLRQFLDEIESTTDYVYESLN
jgi:hypothetical protein